MRYLGACAVLLALQLPAISATAQYIGSAGSASRGISYTAQGTFNEQPLMTNQRDFSVFVGPLASPKFGTNEEAGLHMVRIPGIQFGSLTAGDEGGQTATFIQAGAAYGVTKGLELGLFTPPMLVSPESGTGDLPFFATLGSSIDSTDFGLRTTLTVPTQTTSHWRLNPGIHVLARFDTGRLDFGTFFPIIFAGEDATFASLEIPVRATFKLFDGFFAGLETGVRKLDIAEGENDVFIPLGAYAVYSLAAGEQRIDFTGRFNWHSFGWVGAPEGFSDQVFEDTYMISFGANFLFDTEGIGSSGEKKKEKDDPKPTEPTETNEPDDTDEVRGRPPT